MAYLVLARRYRPQSFSQLVGQEHIVKILSNAITSGRIHHAFLFTGARGTGKTSTARLLAKALNCVNGPTPEPCNKCSHCIDIMEGKEVDVLEIDGATNTGVESVRALREDIRYLPTSAKYRIIIIDEVHMLTVSAFNALLKTLEEPPSHIIFIFATTEPHKIPSTILSRVQRFDFKRVKLDTLTNHVINILNQENFTIEDEAAKLIALKGEGSVRDTLSILDQILANHVDGIISKDEIMTVLGITDRVILKSIINAILNRNSNSIITILNQIFYDGYDIVHFTKSLISYFRDILIIKTCSNIDELVFISSDELNDIKNIIDKFTVQHLYNLFLRLFNGFDSISRSYSPKIALELTLLDLCNSEPLLPLNDLIDKMDKLQKGRKIAPQKLDVINNYTSENSNQNQSPKNTPITYSKPDSGSFSHKSQSLPTQPTKSLKDQKPNSIKKTKSNNVSSEPVKPIEPQISSLEPGSKYGFKEWMVLLESLSSKNINLYHCLRNGRFSCSVKDNSSLIFSLLFPKGENLFCLKKIKDNIKFIETFFSNKTGHNIIIKISVSNKDSLPANWKKLPEGVPLESPKELEQKKSAVKKRTLDETVKSDPFVQIFLNNLNGKITHEKDLQ